MKHKIQKTLLDIAFVSMGAGYVYCTYKLLDAEMWFPVILAIIGAGCLLVAYIWWRGEVTDKEIAEEKKKKADAELVKKLQASKATKNE